MVHERAQQVMEENEKSSNNCSTDINKASSSNSSFGESQFKKRFYRRLANSGNGPGVGRIPVIKVDGNKTANSSIKRTRKKFVLPEHIEEVSKDPPLYKCKICKRSFKEKLHSKYHEPCLTGEKPLICGVCDKGFITRSHFVYHLRIHSDTKPFACSFCPKKFAQKDKLKRHERLTHKKERPHSCTLCSRTFASKQALEVHMNGHLRLRPHKCDLCMRSFSSKTVLQRHRLTHSAIRNFSCDVCDRKFTLKSDLTIHQRVHSGVRPYQCTVDGCNKSFNLKTSYTRHLQTHSELHDYECTICVTAFRRKDNLERHIRNFHPETMVEGHPQQIVSIVQPKNFVPRKSSVSKGVSSRKTSKVDNNLDRSPEIIEPTIDNNEVDKNVKDSNFCEMSSDDLVGSEVREIQERESSSRLELPSFSKSVIVNTVKNTQETSDSLSSEGVSVISNRNKAVENSVKKVHPEQNINRKSSEPILPYRTITPPVQLSDNDRANCVPTITKVTHIVHTSKTGIPNIETVITTRDVTKNRTKHMKENNEGVDKSGKGENVVVEKPKRSKSVINYVPKSSEKTGGKKPVECFRILKPSSEFVTTCSSNLGRVSFPSATVTNDRMSVLNFETFSPRKQQQMYTQEGSLANAFENLCQEILSEDTSRGAASNNRKTRPGLDLASIRFNRAFLQQFGQPADSKVYGNINPETPRFSNRLQSFNNMGMVSDSCLLADNALDHSITDPLYEQEINDSYSLHQMQNVVHNPTDNSFIPPRDTYLESQQLYNYHNYDYDYQPNDNCFESYENHANRGSNYVEEASMNRLGINRFGEENMNGLGEGNFDRLDGGMDRIGGDILNRFGVDNIDRLGGDNMNTLGEHELNRLGGGCLNRLGEDNMNRLGVDNMNRLGEGSMNRLGEDDSNRLGVDNMNRPQGDSMNRLEELRMEYNRIEDQYNRLNNVPLVTKSVIVDQPKPPIMPACSGPRQLPLKKCLWTKSAFGNFLNDSAEVS